jgi:hypothetical protein
MHVLSSLNYKRALDTFADIFININYGTRGSYFSIIPPPLTK